MRILFSVLNILLFTGAFYFGYGAYQKIRPDRSAVQPISSKPIRQDVSSQQKETPSPENYRVIMDRDLFQTKKSGVERSVPSISDTTERLKPTKLLVKLWGTVTSGADASYAIIEDKNKKEQSLYRIGDAIQDATVKEIYRDRIVLNVQGRDEVLQMEKLESGGIAPIRRGPEPTRPTRPPPMRRIRLNRSQLVKAAEGEADVSNQAKIRPYFTDGRQDGMILTGIKPNSLYRRLGLRNGDILMSIDEADIQSAEDVLAVYQSLSDASELTLKIKRRGRLTTLNYTIE